MKKIISIFLLVLYRSTSFAITMDIHYCSGKYSGVTFSNFSNTTNCGCDHNGLHDKTCCTDKIICAKTDNHKVVQQYWVAPDFPDFILPDYFTFDAVDYPHHTSLKSYYSSSGFTRSEFPSFLTFLCTYRI